MCNITSYEDFMFQSFDDENVFYLIVIPNLYFFPESGGFRCTSPSRNTLHISGKVVKHYNASSSVPWCFSQGRTWRVSDESLLIAVVSGHIWCIPTVSEEQQHIRNPGLYSGHSLSVLFDQFVSETSVHGTENGAFWNHIKLIIFKSSCSINPVVVGVLQKNTYYN